MTELISIYIPRMSVTHNEAVIQHALSTIGLVHSVDFVPVSKEKPGFSESYGPFMSAFVYLQPYRGGDLLTPNEYYEYNANLKLMATEFYTAYVANMPFKLHVSHTEYWLLIKNKKTIPRSKMNIHQITENARYMELQMERLEETQLRSQAQVEHMSQMIQEHQTQLGTMSQLIQEQQKQIMILIDLLAQNK